MAKRGRPPKHGGTVYRRNDSEFWQVRYKDQKGEMIRESAATTDREQAERFLRDRLDARDEGRLSALLGSKRLTFNEWADWFLEKRSKPPFRSEGNHQENVNALKSLQTGVRRDGIIGHHCRSDRELPDGASSVEAQNTNQTRTQIGRSYQTGNRASGVRVLTHILNVAVKQKRLAANPCVAVEFPVSVRKSTRKPHYMTASEQQKIEFARPSYLRNIVVIVSELGLRYKKELLPMKKEQVDLENRLGAYRGLEDINRHWRYAIDQCGSGGVPASDGGDARNRVPVSQPDNDRKEAVHDQPAQGLGGDAEESGRAVFRAVRTSAYLRHPAQRGRRRRSHGDADVAAERCGGLQALQSGEARHDARGACEARPASQRAGNFRHSERELNHFLHIFMHSCGSVYVLRKGGQIDSKGVNGGRAGTRTPDLLRVKPDRLLLAP